MRNHKRLRKLSETKEFSLLLLFWVLFAIITLRLVTIQIINAKDYEQEMTKLHYKESLLKAKRGQVFVMDKNKKPIQLTENIAVYDLYVEPQHLKNEENKKRFIELITPYIYQHLCKIRWIERVSAEDCVKNIETYTEKKLLPDKPEFFYLWSGWVSTGYYLYDWSGFNAQYEAVISGFNGKAAERLIEEKLNKKIYIGIRETNYLWFFESQEIIEEFKKLDFIQVFGNYVYITPKTVKKIATANKSIEGILQKNGQEKLIEYAKDQLYPKENTYVKIAQQIHPSIANDIKKLKQTYKNQYQKCKYKTSSECEQYKGVDIDFPLLHGLWLEEYTIRHYPYNSFLAHVLGYVNKEGIATYGIEEYMNQELQWKDGKIIWRTSSFVGDIGANEFEIEQVQNWNDIYLSIDPTIQKEVQNLSDYHKEKTKADSISVIIMDPFTAQIKANVNSPTFNLNSFNEAFTYEPVTIEDAKLIDDISYTDIHLFVKNEDGKFRKATTKEREDPRVPKYKTKNTYSSEIFVDKNIKYPYEPWSIMKTFTVAIWLDSDEITLYDFYEDKGEVKVWPYTIQNIAKECLWENNYLHALVFSCNVWMVRIIQTIGKEIFYNYYQKLGFGKKTWIELAGEEEGFIEWASSTSIARFLNNSFWLWMRATPIQIATAYAAIINGWYLLKPTIIAKTYDQKQQEFIENQPKIIRKVFKSETSTKIKSALFDIVHENPDNKKIIAVDWFSVGGKSWTSEITYKGKYQTQGQGRTNGSYAGIVTKDNLKYLIIIQVRRPRTSKRWISTAGYLFKDIAKFLINYDLIAK